MKKIVHTLAALSLCVVANTGNACTDFKLIAKDKTVLIARSMEFAVPVNSYIRTSPQEREFKTQLAKDKPSINWKSKYGYIYIDGLGVDAAFDGLNEHGLSFEYLYLPGETEYQKVPEGKNAQAIPYYLLGDWVLGNFKNIDEVKAALNSVYVSEAILPQLGDASLPAHAAIYDASGKGIIVEFYDNKINVTDSMGVLTNSPRYDWHVVNLRNYINLSPNNPSPIKEGAFVYASTGQGSGAIGIPGDGSPPSRFVKVAFMAANVYPANNPKELVNLGEHIMNNVDLPAGFSRATTENGKTVTGTTQWVVFKDLAHKVIYYRSYDDMTLRSIELDKVSLKPNAPLLKMPLATDGYVINMTGKFLSSK